MFVEYISERGEGTSIYDGKREFIPKFYSRIRKASLEEVSAYYFRRSKTFSVGSVWTLLPRKKVTEIFRQFPPIDFKHQRRLVEHKLVSERKKVKFEQFEVSGPF